MSHSLSDFYRGKRVMVTGHTGFQGGWAVAWLKLLGAQVCGYGLPPASRPNFFDATLLDREMTSIFSDVRDRNSLANAFTDFQPEIVLHCALRSNPQFANREPVETFSTNVMGTVHILEEAKLTPAVRAVVIVSSPSCNEHKASNYGPVRDASMASVELACSSFSSCFLDKGRAAVATARTVDAIGGGDWGEGRIIPNLVRSLTAGEPVQVVDGLRLPVLHVVELVRAYLLLGQRLFESGREYSGQWDFLPGADRKLAATRIAKEFVKFWDGAESESSLPKTAQKASPAFNRGDDRARTQLGWSEVLPTSTAVHSAAEWYRSFYTNASMVRCTTEEQIKTYMRYATVGAMV